MGPCLKDANCRGDTCPGSDILLSVPLLVVCVTCMRVADVTLMRVLNVTLMGVVDATLMMDIPFTSMWDVDCRCFLYKGKII